MSPRRPSLRITCSARSCGPPDTASCCLVTSCSRRAHSSSYASICCKHACNRSGRACMSLTRSGLRDSAAPGDSSNHQRSHSTSPSSVISTTRRLPWPRPDSLIRPSASRLDISCDSCPELIAHVGPSCSWRRFLSSYAYAGLSSRRPSTAWRADISHPRDRRLAPGQSLLRAHDSALSPAKNPTRRTSGRSSNASLNPRPPTIASVCISPKMFPTPQNASLQARFWQSRRFR